MENRITVETIENAIKSEHYFTAAEGELGHRYCKNEDLFGIPHELEMLTFCCLVLNNGFVVVGKSACAHPENFNEQTGRLVARQDAISKCWELLGFMLKTRLANAAKGAVGQEG